MTIPGDGVSHTVSIYEGYTLEREIAREVKEKLRCFGADYDTELKSNRQRKPISYQTETSSLSTLNRSIASICCSSQISVAKKPTGATTLLSNTARSATLTSARICTFMSGGQVARPCSKESQHMTKELTTLAPSTMKIKDVLPDDDIITVAPNISFGSRVLFHPCFTDKQASGVHDTSSCSAACCSIHEASSTT